MKVRLLMVLVVAALAGRAEGKPPSAAQLNAAKNEADLARFRRQAREEVGTGIATPEQVEAMNFVGPPPAWMVPAAPATADPPAPKAEPKAEKAPARKAWELPGGAFNPFAPEGPDRIPQDARQAGHLAAMRAGIHAGRLSPQEIRRRGKVAAKQARLTGEYAEVFEREFLAGFASALAGRR